MPQTTKRVKSDATVTSDTTPDSVLAELSPATVNGQANGQVSPIAASVVPAGEPTTMQALAKRFETLSPTAALEFFSSDDLWRSQLMPVEKSVPVCRTAGIRWQLSDDDISRMLAAVVNGDETGKFDKLNMFKAASSVATRGDATTIAIDFDIPIFARGSNGVAHTINRWVLTHQSAALKVRGNRERLTLIFALSSELREYLKDSYDAGSKKIYICGVSPSQRIEKDAELGQVELKWRGVNTTLWGEHPKTGKDYQQILPTRNGAAVEANIGDSDANFSTPSIGSLSVAAFTSLVATLNAIAYEGDKIERSEYSDRSPIEDIVGDAAYVCVKKQQAIADQYRTTGRLPKEFDYTPLSIGKLLNDKEQQIVAGKLQFRSGGGKDSSGKNRSYKKRQGGCINEGYRRQTFLCVGSGVNQVVELLDALGLPYDEGEVEEIFEKLLADVESPRSFTVRDAQAAFSGYARPMYKDDYVAALCKKIVNELERQRAVAIAQCKKEQPASTAAITGETTGATDNGTSDESVNTASDTAPEDDDDLVMDDLDEQEENPDPVDHTAEPVDAVLSEVKAVAALTKETHAAKRSLKQRVTNDRWDNVHIRLRKLVEAKAATSKGSSYAFQTGLYAVTMPLLGHTKAVNTSCDSATSRKVFSTYLLPFALVLAASAVGKSDEIKTFDVVRQIVKTYFSHVYTTEKKEFKDSFCDKNGNFQDPTDGDPTAALSLTPGSGDDNDPDIVEYVQDSKMQLHRLISEFDRQSATPATFLKAKHSTYLANATEAGFRDAYLNQSLTTSVKTITNDIGSTIIERPIGIIEDEIGGLFSKIYQRGNHSFDPQWLCARKEATALEYVTATQRSGSIDKAGATLYGAMTTGDYLSYLAQDTNKPTLGLLPRTLLTMIESEEADPNGSIEPQEIDDSETDNGQLLRLYLAVYTIVAQMMAIETQWTTDTVLAPSSYRNVSGNVIICANTDAQRLMNKTSKDVLKWRNRLIASGDFSKDQEDYIRVVAAKGWQEMAILIGSQCITRQFLNLTFELLDKCGRTTAQWLELMGSGDRVSNEFVGAVKQMMKDRAGLGSTHPIEMSNVPVINDVEVAADIYMHSLDTTEYLLRQLVTSNKGSLETRSRIATQEARVVATGSHSYKVEKWVGSLFKHLKKLSAKPKSDRKFTFGALRKANKGAKNMSDDWLTMIGETLVDAGIVTVAPTPKTNNGSVTYTFTETPKLLTRLNDVEMSVKDAIANMGAEL